MSEFRGEVESYFRGLRDRIVTRLGELDGGAFVRTSWEREGGGGGEMSEIRGALFEKGGCNFSAVRGGRYPHVPSVASAQGEGSTGAHATGADPANPRPARSAEDRARDDTALGIVPPRPEELAGKEFFATGVSLVIHPRNPFVPVVHMNVRYLEVGGLGWFGGGTDLTPCRPFAEDTAHFHATCEKALAPHGDALYPRCSQWAKDYFFIAHRKSERGVGGIFFDYLRGTPLHSNDLGAAFAVVRSVGDSFLEAYAPLVEKRRETPYTEAEREEQLRWRGRYVEFNLVYDRGTIFGLKTGGNVEAIFMSLPPLVSW
jgi:coproporphyrinogen III oxidase